MGGAGRRKTVPAGTLGDGPGVVAEQEVLELARADAGVRLPRGGDQAVAPRRRRDRAEDAEWHGAGAEVAEAAQREGDARVGPLRVVDDDRRRIDVRGLRDLQRAVCGTDDAALALGPEHDGPA